MEYTTLGSTGVTVSELCLGCMSFGSSEWRDWVLDEEEAREVIERAIDLGINFFDTANMYSQGESERVLGNVLDDYDRDRQVVATKVFHPMGDDPNAGGLSRKTIEQELENSLDRLGMDTVDLYQIHRWDYDTPIEETLRALDDAVRRGRVRYVGASSMWAHQFADALHTSDELGLERFATMQDHYNLVYREEEREMLPLCEKEDVGVMAWSPLARGYLTRPHEDIDATTRGASEEYMYEHPYREGGGPEVNERVGELAAEKGVKRAQIALAWLLHKDTVTTPIVGTSSVEHLEDAVEATELDLSSSEMEYLEEPYEPVRVSGHE
ncbi:MAG: aldo/keto reductase [Halarchaeum sp.]